MAQINLWFYVIMFFWFCGLAFFASIWVISRATLRWMFFKPAAEVRRYYPNGTIESWHLSEVDGSWKIQSDNPKKIKFKIKKGMFGTEDMECDADDYQELPRQSDKSKIVVEIGLKHRKFLDYQRYLNKCSDFNSEFNRRVTMETRIKQIESQIGMSIEKFVDMHGKANRAGPVFKSPGGSK